MTYGCVHNCVFNITCFNSQRVANIHLRPSPVIPPRFSDGHLMLRSAFMLPCVNWNKRSERSFYCRAIITAFLPRRVFCVRLFTFCPAAHRDAILAPCWTICNNSLWINLLKALLTNIVFTHLSRHSKHPTAIVVTTAHNVLDDWMWCDRIVNCTSLQCDLLTTYYTISITAHLSCALLIVLYVRPTYFVYKQN